jgi:hypothetical protein
MCNTPVVVFVGVWAKMANPVKGKLELGISLVLSVVAFSVAYIIWRMAHAPQ